MKPPHCMIYARNPNLYFVRYRSIDWFFVPIPPMATSTVNAPLREIGETLLQNLLDEVTPNPYPRMTIDLAQIAIREELTFLGVKDYRRHFVEIDATLDEDAIVLNPMPWDPDARAPNWIDPAYAIRCDRNPETVGRAILDAIAFTADFDFAAYWDEKEEATRRRIRERDGNPADVATVEPPSAPAPSSPTMMELEAAGFLRHLNPATDGDRIAAARADGPFTLHSGRRIDADAEDVHEGGARAFILHVNKALERIGSRPLAMKVGDGEDYRVRVGRRSYSLRPPGDSELGTEILHLASSINSELDRRGDAERVHLIGGGGEDGIALLLDSCMAEVVSKAYPELELFTSRRSDDRRAT